ncbi:MAG: hypothetical protein COU32_01575 [Candidatus Magasanikbacteria bacterium CG10_big_fil_rev_8_21_14_0_10_42_10]|uniref:DUF5671 domain-containing protein n=2 Tax=Candidatus Magasanikiibacteriota TaxID=1752731 RepID=A0A2H0TWM2_9BACT|nr:MAG: hypothetical protein COU32_01575 [Candidatus Magasanikbacteria bacterium CG10_big_fil_rev_8_21_14_0_10_42_10]PIZ94536.1 MAG: hypothetical protein COX82_00435 [Candidatus Magasanikbacteria bacterium CG_4_10_14_0_2_um_filter_41_10]
MNFRIKKVFSFLVILFFCIPSIVYAKQTVSDAPTALNTVADRVGVDKTSIPVYVGTIVNAVLLLVGIIFFILMFYAGFRWMTARGEEEKIGKARKTLIGATIGLVVIISSYALTNFITTRILEGKPNEGGSINFENTDFTNVGCCFDKVRGPSGSLEVGATTWAWRITTQGDCKDTGEKASSIDELYGPGTWKFQAVDSKQQCEALWNTFCESTSCYDLGF